MTSSTKAPLTSTGIWSYLRYGEGIAPLSRAELTAATRQGALPDGTSGEPHARSTKQQLAMDGARAWGVGFKSHEVVDMDGC
jgi:hypothetical protein